MSEHVIEKTPEPGENDPRCQAAAANMNAAFMVAIVLAVISTAGLIFTKLF